VKEQQQEEEKEKEKTIYFVVERNSRDCCFI